MTSTPSTAWAHDILRRYQSADRSLAPHSVAVAVAALRARGELREDYVQMLRARGFRLEGVV